jgi:hypothetical protein
MLRQRVLRISALVPIFVVLLVMGLSALPSRVAHACLPCACETYRTVNCFGPYALYTPVNEKDGTCAIDIWTFQDDGQGKRTLLITAKELAAVPEVTEEERYVTVDTAMDGWISVYKLFNGQYQINVGPAAESKVYTINFTGCPPEGDVVEGNFIAGA